MDIPPIIFVLTGIPIGALLLKLVQIATRSDDRLPGAGEVMHSCGSIVPHDSIRSDGVRDVCPYCEDN